MNGRDKPRRDDIILHGGSAIKTDARDLVAIMTNRPNGARYANVTSRAIFAGKLPFNPLQGDHAPHSVFPSPPFAVPPRQSFPPRNKAACNSAPSPESRQRQGEITRGVRQLLSPVAAIVVAPAADPHAKGEA